MTNSPRHDAYAIASASAKLPVLKLSITTSERGKVRCETETHGMGVRRVAAVSIHAKLLGSLGLFMGKGNLVEQSSARVILTKGFTVSVRVMPASHDASVLLEKINTINIFKIV